MSDFYTCYPLTKELRECYKEGLGDDPRNTQPLKAYACEQIIRNFREYEHGTADCTDLVVDLEVLKEVYYDLLLSIIYTEESKN